MTEHFNPVDFEEPIYDMGRDAMVRLQSALDGDLLADGVWGGCAIKEQSIAQRTTHASVQYSSTIIDGINLELIKQDLPPNYLVQMCGTLALSLVDHLNDRYSSSGESQLYAPDQTAVQRNLQGLWLTIPDVIESSDFSTEVFHANKYHAVTLNLAKAIDTADWYLDFSVNENIVLMRHLLDDIPGNVTIHRSLFSYFRNIR